MTSLALFTVVAFIAVQAAFGINFITRKGDKFYDGGAVYNVAGTNNYYLPFAPTAQVDDAIQMAKEMGVRVIRTWAFNVAGDPKGNYPKNARRDHYGLYFHYWDPASKSSKFNENSIKKLDYAVSKAAQAGIRLILVLTNNWCEYGGVAQYNLWFSDIQNHPQFYTNANAKNEYKKWVSYLLNRKNTYTGRAYKDEPAIFAWELINEARCEGTHNTEKECPNAKPAQGSCSPSTIANWVAEMAKYVKSIDKNHLVAVGDEGHMSGGSDFGYDGKNGDTALYAKVPEIDFTTFHKYPDNFKRSRDGWTDEFIAKRIQVAKNAGKPFIMEEFGILDYNEDPNSPQSVRNQYYDKWAKQICRAGGHWLYWGIAGKKADRDDQKVTDLKELYPDYDHYTVYFKDKYGKITPSGQKMKDRIYNTINRKYC